MDRAQAERTGSAVGLTRPGAGEDNVVEVHDIAVHFHTQLGLVRALNGVSFNIPRRKVLGVVGESGCGKSVTGLTILQLVPYPGQVVSGQVWLRTNPGEQPVDLLTYERDSDEMRRIRGRHIAMIFQEPMTSLNPCYTVGNQIMEAILIHRTTDQTEARQLAIDVLGRVGMPDPRRVIDLYPHELSGGMRQRAMIAMGLSCQPDLLIADEPTTALDVTTEAQILDLMRELQAETGMAIMFITHNLGVVAQMCDEVAVMYLGRIVEQASIEEIFYNPKHPYTISLLRSIPRLGTQRKERLESIRGSVPDPYTIVPGCPFHPRCPAFMPGTCDVLVPEMTPIEGSVQHTVRCHLYPGSTVGSAQGSSAAISRRAPATTGTAGSKEAAS